MKFTLRVEAESVQGSKGNVSKVPVPRVLCHSCTLGIVPQSYRSHISSGYKVTGILQNVKKFRVREGTDVLQNPQKFQVL